MNSKKGFTLIEVLIAITILTVIMMVVYQAFTASTDGIKRAEAVDDINSTARVIFLKLMDDINSAYLTGKDVIFVGDSKRDKELPQD
ncbi:MAG: type II secretion system protein, partial [Nitrospirae bacterium]|nr:type II secretion system protein [Nitrospirota bacterium]